MCNHYNISKPKKKTGIEGFEPQYHANGFDFPKLPVVLSDGQPHLVNWGLVPSWVKEWDQAKELRVNTLNARSETVKEKPSFRNAFNQGRFCVVLANGFYEWMEFNGKKYPHFIYLKDRPLFGMAGIWDIWLDKHTGEELKTFSILTCEANELMAKIHNKKMRMPVILDEGQEKNWLQSGEQNLMKPFDSHLMEAHTISKVITSRTENTNFSGITDKVIYPELDFTQGTLF